MDEFGGTYAPQSPDLSEYQSYEQPDSITQAYQPPPPQHSSFQQPTYQQQYNYNLPNSAQPFDPFAPQEPVSNQLTYQQQSLPSMPKNRRTKDQFDDDDFTPEQPAPKPGRQSKKQKVEEVCDKPAPGDDEGVDVKTKFPVARIKRIMQADEDVGKVSQVTPTAVSKALELFIISLTLKSATVARGKSSKRVTAAHLKQAVVGDEQLDFLEPLVSKIPDAPTGSKSEGKKKGVATEGEESSDDAYVEGKGKKKGGEGRKKRAKVVDD
ncbi:uncharacterized protein KY384_003053 [Bacidia gigantensis]|uniref:uncharacterized protein n=1 Tax=Bacidia gigantensis TaxID=2732470 RepID=UPI001D040175|nr:uncharacterized protein KY384_003053 [Bacidia gigantensis]KAG8531424.1 hypothetical protein KY384_003053 [Bacidia gigantensis]